MITFLVKCPHTVFMGNLAHTLERLYFWFANYHLLKTVGMKAENSPIVLPTFRLACSDVSQMIERYNLDPEKYCIFLCLVWGYSMRLSIHMHMGSIHKKFCYSEGSIWKYHKWGKSLKTVWGHFTRSEKYRKHFLGWAHSVTKFLVKWVHFVFMDKSACTL